MKRIGCLIVFVACVFVVAFFLRDATSSSRLIYRKQVSSSCTFSVYRNTNEKAKELGLVEYEITFHPPFSIGLVGINKIRVADSKSELDLRTIEDEASGLVCVVDANGIVIAYDKFSEESWVAGRSIGDLGTSKEVWESRLEAIASKYSISPTVLEVVNTDQQFYSL